MDKTTKLFIRVACGIIIFTGITITAPFVEELFICLFVDDYKCIQVPFMKWKYKPNYEIKKIIIPPK